MGVYMWLQRGHALSRKDNHIAWATSNCHHSSGMITSSTLKSELILSVKAGPLKLELHIQVSNI